MNPLPFIKNSLITIALLTLSLAAAAHAQSKEWLPITPEELGMKTPKVEADADAEVLYWDVRISDNYVPRSGFNTTLENYVRIKIFTDRGRDKHSRVDIPFGKIDDIDTEIVIKDLAARTIRSDGTIVDLKSSDIYDKEVVKGVGIKVKVKSFVFPSATKDSIIEYRWKETRWNVLSNYLPLQFAREIPVQHVRYSIKPFTGRGFPLGMRLYSSNTAEQFVKDKEGYFISTMTDVPSFKEEPYMPGELRIRPWVLVYYDNDDDKATAESFWRQLSKESYNAHKSWLAPQDSVKKVAEQITSNVTNPLEKVARIYDYCRANIVNVDDEVSGITPERLKTIEKNNSPSDVLKRGTGTWHDINLLFGSMLNAVGVEARVALVSRRTEPAFDRGLGIGYFIRSMVIAAKINNDWMFFDPRGHYLNLGMLPWMVEGETAMITDPDQPIFVKTAVSSPDLSRKIRTADLRLTEDGSLEGDVRIEYTGHIGVEYKSRYDTSSPAEREKALIDDVKKLVSDAAEITSVSIENISDRDKPLAYAFHIRVPAYAQVTGKRLFLVPDLFERGSESKFSRSERLYDVAFPYAWSEADEVTIHLPSGYSPESIDPPTAINDVTKNSSLDINLSLSADRSVLKYKRTFLFGSQSVLGYDQYKYKPVRQLFDLYHNAGMQGVMLARDGK